VREIALLHKRKNTFESLCRDSLLSLSKERLKRETQKRDSKERFKRETQKRDSKERLKRETQKSLSFERDSLKRKCLQRLSNVLLRASQ